MEHGANSRLDFTGWEGGLLVVGGQTSSFTRNALIDTTDEGVHNTHSLLADTCVQVDLVEYLVDLTLNITLESYPTIYNGENRI